MIRVKGQQNGGTSSFAYSIHHYKIIHPVLLYENVLDEVSPIWTRLLEIPRFNNIKQIV